MCLVDVFWNARFALRPRGCELLTECLLEPLSLVELLVDVGDIIVRQPTDPGGVVEGLRDDVSGSSVALEFDNVKIALGVDCEQVELLPARRPDLLADDQEIVTQQIRIFDKELFERYRESR